MKKIDLVKKNRINVEILITFLDGSDTWVDEIEGLTLRDAMNQARNNWIDCQIVYLSHEMI